VSVDYGAFAETLRATGFLSDPWIDGEPRFRAEPVLLSAGEWSGLCHAAEAMAAVHNELCLLCQREPELLDELFGLSPYQKLMWLSSAPSWHGIARADAFLTPSGISVCELNCDTPSGEAEAVLLGALAAPEHPDHHDPSRLLAPRVCQMIEALAKGLARPCARPPDRLSVGILYPTELTEDLSMVLLYQQWFEERGMRVTLGSPFNLGTGPGGTVTVLETPCDVILRHYKTDWWGEREPVWATEAPFPDDEPLAAPLGILLAGVLQRRCVVVNPLGSVLPQNKRSMALLWERIDRFPAWAREAIRAYLPYTVRLETADHAVLLKDKDDWVLKSDYGCEGDEVVLGREATEAEFRDALTSAVPGRWIAQRYFQACVDPQGMTPNHGVYLVAGQAAGVLTRLQRGKTDLRAQCVATLVERS
jgi:glutathionylspermidine synthase